MECKSDLCYTVGMRISSRSMRIDVLHTIIEAPNSSVRCALMEKLVEYTFVARSIFYLISTCFINCTENTQVSN